MSIDTERFAGELRERLDLEELRSTLDFDTVLAGSKRARRRRAVVASTVAAGSIAALVVAGPPLVDLGHRVAEAAQRERLAGVHGIAGDLSKPLDVAWQAGGTFEGVSEPSGTILLDADHAFEALDPATGQVRWSVPVDDDHFCRPPTETGSGGVGSTAAAGPGRVLCAATADGTIQVRDVITGDIVTTMTVAWPEWQAALMDGAVVVFGVDQDGHAVARSADPETGAVNWTYRGETAIPSGGDGFGMVVGPGTVGLVAGAWSVSLDVATGEPRAKLGAVEQRPVGLAGGLTAIQSGGVNVPPGAWSVRVLASDGTELLRVPGTLEQPAVDDGSMRGLVLVRTLSTNAIDAIDVTTGTTLWSRGGFWPGALVDGHLVATSDSGDALLVLDATTGEQVWTAQLHLPSYGLAPLTDGVNVLTLEDAAGQPNLVARDLRTGSVVWAEPWAPGENPLLRALPSGDVLVSTDTGITVFGP